MSADALHVAIVAAIKADTGLTALIDGRVYDWPDSETVYPFVSVGDIIETPWDTSSATGSDCVVTLHTWTRGASARADARIIGEALVELLHRKPQNITVTGCRVPLIEYLQGSVDRESNGGPVIGHGIYRFRIPLRKL